MIVRQSDNVPTANVHEFYSFETDDRPLCVWCVCVYVYLIAYSSTFSIVQILIHLRILSGG